MLGCHLFVPNRCTSTSVLPECTLMQGVLWDLSWGADLDCRGLIPWEEARKPWGAGLGEKSQRGAG